MSEKTRDSLKTTFSNGQRPEGPDFANLIDSFVSKQNDFDGDGNLRLTRGVQLGDSAGTTAGGLRFNSNQLQVFTGGAWTNVSGGGGGGGGFQAVPSTPQSDVVRDSKVGIGAFTVAAPPTFRLEVPLGTSGAPADQVRFGNVVCSNGAGASVPNAAVIAHQQQASVANVNFNFALRQQGATGEVHLNAPVNQIISLRQGGASVRLGVSTSGNVIVGDDSNQGGTPATTNFQVAGTAYVAVPLQIGATTGSTATTRLTVNGDAAKTTGGSWGVTSDARVKQDVRELEAGLAELRQVRPVRFRYNGAGGTPDGVESVGVIAQEIEKVLPETVRRLPDEHGLEELRIFDASPLPFMLINAVKELAARVEHLERALAAAAAAGADPRAVLA